MNSLFPKAVEPYAKAWLAVIGTALQAVLVAWADAPQWLSIAAAAITAVSVYLAPNKTEATEE